MAAWQARDRNGSHASGGETRSSTMDIHPQGEPRHFPCSNCGASVAFSVADGTLKCPYCGSESAIPESHTVIEEFDFRAKLHELAGAETMPATPVSHCDNCGADVSFDSHVHAGDCPFCGSPVVKTPAAQRRIRPRSLLPFAVPREQALEQFRCWMKGIWFAPNSLTKYARDHDKLAGIYVPHWTYDAETETQYRGQRGDFYQVPESYTALEDGLQVVRTRMVTKVRWTPVSGRVSRFFDDVLVLASRSLPESIVRRLQPWDLQNLVPYEDEYLSGLRSEMYQIDLAQGFERAREIMAGTIRRDIARNIGGDQQRITGVDTRYGDIHFKHLLLPVWVASFRYRDKVYRFVVNARTGEVQGERPYSAIKIVLAVLVGSALIAGGIWGYDYYTQLAAFSDPS